MPKLIRQQQQGSTTFSFYQNTKKRLIDEFGRIQEQYNLSNLVLVLDLPSATIISGLFSTTQLVEYNIVFVERLEVVRKVLPHHAIYFITPNEQSIAAMLKDFQNEDNPQYRKVHVLLTDTLQESLMRDISKSKTFLKKLARHSFKQFYCQLSIISDNCLQMDLSYLQHAYSRQNSKQKELRALIGKRFVHLAAAYPNLHTVRFLYDKTAANKVAERVVERSSKEIKQYLMKLLEMKSNAIDPNAPDLTFFVVDRSVDVVTPVLHGYSYESLLYDILDSDAKHREEYQKLPKEIFDEFRYRHISYALEELPKRLDALLEKTAKPGNVDPLQLKKLIEEKQKLNIHVQLLHRLFEEYQQKNLSQIGELELSLATGVTEDGKQTVSSEIVGRVVGLVKNNNVLTKKEKIRLAILVLICVKLTKEDYQMLLSLFQEEHKNVLVNLVAFGVSYDKKISKSTKNIEKTVIDRARQLLEEKNIPSERFQSALEITLPRFISLLKRDTKGIERKPLGEVVVSVSTDSLPPKFDQKRLVLFMCGGLSSTEICNIRRDHSLDSVVLATDRIITPSDLVDSLAKFDILNQ